MNIVRAFFPQNQGTFFQFWKSAERPPLVPPSSYAPVELAELSSKFVSFCISCIFILFIFNLNEVNMSYLYNSETSHRSIYLN